MYNAMFLKDGSYLGDFLPQNCPVGYSTTAEVEGAERVNWQGAEGDPMMLSYYCVFLESLASLKPSKRGMVKEEKSMGKEVTVNFQYSYSRQ